MPFPFTDDKDSVLFEQHDATFITVRQDAEGSCWMILTWTCNSSFL